MIALRQKLLHGHDNVTALVCLELTLFGVGDDELDLMFLVEKRLQVVWADEDVFVEVVDERLANLLCFL